MLYITAENMNNANVHARVSSTVGRLLVCFEQISDQTRPIGNFQFVTFKPDSAAAVAGFPRRQIQPLNTPADDQIYSNFPPPTPRMPVIVDEVTTSPTQVVQD